VRTTITPAQIRADFRGLDQVSKRGAAARTLASFTLLDGRPGVRAS
jgi:alkaline phosphatase D